jgi:hypothetical protein
MRANTARECTAEHCVESEDFFSARLSGALLLPSPCKRASKRTASWTEGAFLSRQVGDNNASVIGARAVASGRGIHHRK